MVTIARQAGGNRAQALPAHANTDTRASIMSLRAAAILFATIATLLTGFAMYVPQARADVWTINRVQEFDAPYLHEIITVVSTLTSSIWAIALWAIALVAF